MRLKLLGVVAEVDEELLKVDAENEPKFIWGGAGCWNVIILCEGKTSCVATGTDRKSAEDTGGSTGAIGGARVVDVDEVLEDVGAGEGGTVGNSAAIFSETETVGTGGVGPGTLISGKIVLKLKLM